jgi:hypothetical protein
MDDIEFKAAKTISCPIATQDIPVNLKNRQNAIDNGGYGPLNPTQANNVFWKKKASRWNVTIGESKKQTCGNCAAFIRTPRMLECIDKGLGNEKGDTAWDVIDAGELGYCESFDFKCASSRTCDAWIVGGPITEEKGKKQETKSLENFLSVKEENAIEFFESLSNREFVALFPNEYTDEANDVKWLFDVSYDFADRLINSRQAGAISYNDKSAKLRDPEGGLTAAGRKHFNNKEGANLKPGVKGPADTPEKMRRKGSFLVRFFTNPSGPMQDGKGNPTRLALSASAWGEPVPKTAAAAAKLAAKGSRLLERYKNLKEAKKKKDAFGDIEIKAAAPATIGSSGSRTIGQSNPSRKPQTIGGRSGGSSSSENYNPNARDADGDGTVQEGTEFMRAAQPRPATADRDKRSERADKRGITRSELEAMGFDGEEFMKLMDAESRKLKPGQKTNWNPGSLPNGGKIAPNGTYISPEMVRIDEMRSRDSGGGGDRRRANAPRLGTPPEPRRPRLIADGMPTIPDKPRTGWLSPYFAGDYAHDPMDD